MTGGPLRRECAAESDTLALGERIGVGLLPGDLLSLSGPLGAGKTVLVRGLALGAGADSLTVRSPTFVLHHVYPGARVTLHHVDLYRLGSDADIGFLDVEGLLEDGAVAVEWGDLANLERFNPTRIVIDVERSGVRACTLGAGAPPRLASAWHVGPGVP